MKRFVKSLALIFTILAAFASVACKISVNSKDPVTYKVTYQTERETAPAAIKVKKNAVLTESQLPALTSKGYTFLGWYDSETKAEPGQYKVTKDVTLIAKWEIVQNAATTYTVKFNSMGGNDIPDQTVASGQKATRPADPTKTAIASESYSFDNWYTSTDNGQTFSSTAFDFNTPITASITLYAKWIVTPTAFETPLTLEFIESGTVTINNPWETLQYSKNGESLQQYPSTGDISVEAGDTISFYAEESGLPMTIQCTSDCYIYGNVMSLVTLKPQTGEWNPYKPADTWADFSELFRDNTHIKNHNEKELYLPGIYLGNMCYEYMFAGCTSLTRAPALPAKELKKMCYQNMFSGCTNLIEAPALPATILAESCYEAMFSGCTKLTTAPDLPATTLAKSCYDEMFYGCTNLTTVPDLPATTLADICYRFMFHNCKSLRKAPALPATKLADACYISMFSGCTNLTTAPDLPATTLIDSCYMGMFEDCTSLTSAPALPATTLADDCYYEMFSGCTSLTTAPALPATTLAEACYYKMFNGCTSLTTAPELPATTLAGFCYQEMFNGCTNLNHIECLATNKTAKNCTLDWVIGVSKTGTFIKNKDMTSWTNGTNGIPEGWTVRDAQ